MQLSKLSAPLKKNVVLSVAVGVIGLAGLLYTLHKRRGKKNNLSSPKHDQKWVQSADAISLKNPIPEKSYDVEEVIYLRNKDMLEEKIFRLKAAGVDHLQAIINFDQTITSFTYNDKPVTSLIKVFHKCSFASLELVEKFKANLEKFLPIQQDSSISREEKIKYLEDWWKTEEELLVSLNLNKEKISKIIEESNLAFRYGFNNFMKTLDMVQLPTYIVSGGVLDMMRPILEKSVILCPENLKLFGNTMIFDKTGNFKSFATPHLNSFHKEFILSKKNTEANFRKNAILIGDTIHDRFMTANLSLDVVLSIGFLQPQKKDQLEQYMEAYDIVILGDGNFTQIEAVLREVAGLPQRNAVKKLLEEFESPLKSFITYE